MEHFGGACSFCGCTGGAPPEPADEPAPTEKQLDLIRRHRLISPEKIDTLTRAHASRIIGAFFSRVKGHKTSHQSIGSGS